MFRYTAVTHVYSGDDWNDGLHKVVTHKIGNLNRVELENVIRNDFNDVTNLQIKDGKTTLTATFTATVKDDNGKPIITHCSTSVTPMSE